MAISDSDFLKLIKLKQQQIAVQKCINQSQNRIIDILEDSVQAG